MVQYIQFNVNSDGSDVVVTGSNTATEEDDYVNAQTILTQHRNFFVAEATAWLAENHASDPYDDTRLTKEQRKIILRIFSI